VGSPAQAALDSLVELIEREHIGSQDIAAIEVHLPGSSARTVDSAPAPNLNVQHLLAMLLVDGKLNFATIHDRGRMGDAEILALREKITLVQSRDLAQARPRRQAIVNVKTGDGRMLSHRTVAVRGTADNPMTATEVEAKAVDLMGGILTQRQAKAMIAAIREIEAAGDMTDLRRLWQTSKRDDAS
jgi:2-methylcitrate dehydratase PrpD